METMLSDLRTVECDVLGFTVPVTNIHKITVCHQTPSQKSCWLNMWLSPVVLMSLSCSLYMESICTQHYEPVKMICIICSHLLNFYDEFCVSGLSEYIMHTSTVQLIKSRILWLCKPVKLRETELLSLSKTEPILHRL